MSDDDAEFVASGVSNIGVIPESKHAPSHESAAAVTAVPADRLKIRRGWTDGSAIYQPSLSELFVLPETVNKQKENAWLERLGISEWPEGYKALYGVTKPGGNIRYDLYLFGHPHGKFRSQNEFAPHLAYLENPFLEPCHCYICNRRMIKAEVRETSSPIRWLPERGSKNLLVRRERAKAVISRPSRHFKMGKTCSWNWPSEYRPGEVVWACLQKGNEKIWKPAQVLEVVRGDRLSASNLSPFTDQHTAKRQRRDDGALAPQDLSLPDHVPPRTAYTESDPSGPEMLSNAGSPAGRSTDEKPVYRLRQLPVASFDYNVGQEPSKLYLMEEVNVSSLDINPWTARSLENLGRESDETWHSAVIQAVSLSSTWGVAASRQTTKIKAEKTSALLSEGCISTSPECRDSKCFYPCFRFGTEEIRVNDLVELPTLDNPGNFPVPAVVRELQFSRDPIKNRMYLEVTKIWSAAAGDAKALPSCSTLWITGNLFRLVTLSEDGGTPRGPQLHPHAAKFGFQPVLENREVGAEGGNENGDKKEREGDAADHEEDKGSEMVLQATVSVCEIAGKAYAHLLGGRPRRMPVVSRGGLE